MPAWSYVYILTCLLLHGELSSSLGMKNLSCHQRHTCVCEFPNGEGLDLTLLNVRVFSLVDKEHNSTFYFNPCRADKDPSACPNETSICLLNNTAGYFTSLGFISETSFLSHGLDISLVFNHENVQTQIHLECTKGPETAFLFSNEDKQSDKMSNSHKFVLKSPEACIRWLSGYSDSIGTGNESLSTGSVLVIILLIFGSVYFLGGSVANHLLRGATGWEMVPNRDFWLDLPKLCVDGFKFTVNGCSVPPSYEQI